MTTKPEQLCVRCHHLGHIAHDMTWDETANGWLCDDCRVPPTTKLREALDILDAVLAGKRSTALLARCRLMVASALDDFFTEADDVAALPAEEETVFLDATPPRPRAG
jgi:hypothetical protein